MKTCPHCNQKNPDIALFCKECGYPLEHILSIPDKSSSKSAKGIKKIRSFFKTNSDFSSERRNPSGTPNIFSKKKLFLIFLTLLEIVFIAWLIYYTSVSQISNRNVQTEKNRSMRDGLPSVNSAESNSNAEKETVLMDMVGKNILDDDVSAMQDELKNKGINIYTEEVYSDSWDLWSIISQSVDSGTSLDTFSSILITLNGGKNLTGWSMDDAITDLTSADREYSIQHKYDPTVKAGHIIENYRIPGTSKIMLIVSDGWEKLEMPQGDYFILSDKAEVTLSTDEPTIVIISCGGMDLPEHYDFYGEYFGDYQTEWLDWVDNTTRKLKIQRSAESGSTTGYFRAYVIDTDSDTKLSYTDIYVDFKPTTDSLTYPEYDTESEYQNSTVDSNEEMLISEPDLLEIENQPLPYHSTWITSSILQKPTNYMGRPYRLVLNQTVSGEIIETTVAEGDTLSFPYQINCVGIKGVSDGNIILYEMNENEEYSIRCTWPIVFTESS